MSAIHHSIPKLLGHALLCVRQAREITGNRPGRPPEAQALVYAAGYSAAAAGRLAGQIVGKNIRRAQRATK